MAASDTSQRILEAARRAMAERGIDRLTMATVARAAGVSRPTLYRWFPTKQLLLSAAAAYEEDLFIDGLRRLLPVGSEPALRLDCAVRYLVTYLERSGIPDPIAIDPILALRTLAQGMARQVDTLTLLLDDALDEIPAVRAGAVCRAQAVEVLLRLAYSHFLIPHSDTDELLAVLRAFLGVPTPSESTAPDDALDQGESPHASTRRNRATAKNQITDRTPTSSRARSHGAGRVQPTRRAPPAPAASAGPSGR